MKISTDVFDPTALLHEESIFHTANGYIGVRANFEEGVPDSIPTIRGCRINGFYDTVELKHTDKRSGFPKTSRRTVNLPDLQTTRLYINGEEFSLFTGDVIEFNRTLDMSLGIVTRTALWRSPKGNKLKLSFTRMASFLRKELFFTQISIAGEGEVKIVSETNCSVFDLSGEEDPLSAEKIKHVHMRSAGISGARSVALCRTSKSGLDVAAAMGHSFNQPCEPHTILTPNGLRTTVTINLGTEPLIIDKFCAYSDSRRQQNCQKHALSVIDRAMSDGAKALLLEQQGYLFDFWNKTGTKIYHDKINESMAYNLYGLLQSAGNDKFSDIHARGISLGDGDSDDYSFQSAEIFTFPFFLLTKPERAKNFLDLRYSFLDSAREQARLMGHQKGALYTYMTVTGRECEEQSLSALVRYHVTGDVARSFLQYYHVTGDLDYMEEKGAEVLIETARLWACAAGYDRNGRLCVNGVAGPDEYTCVVNNNYFTNLSAKHNLLAAVYICEELEKHERLEEVAEKLGLSKEELDGFKKAAGDMFIPCDEELDINPQDDSFLDKTKWDLTATPKEKFPLLENYHPLFLHRHQVCSQAEVILAHYMYDDADESVMRHSYDYYEDITAHDSALSYCAFSIMASRLGMPEKAYDYFAKIVRAGLDEGSVNTAVMGGAYLAVVSGFTGLKIREDGLHFHFTCPEKWSGYEFNLNYKGSVIHIYVSPDSAEVNLRSGAPVKIFAFGSEYTVTKEKLEIDLKQVVS